MQNDIRKMSGKKYQARLAENPLVIVPTGACEIYGPHLPMGTDLLVAQKIAELVAEKTGALIAPTIEAGESSALEAFSCTFPLPRKILEDYLEFLVSKLIADGAKKLLFINGHAGNVDTVSYVVKKHLKDGIKACQIDWWRFTQARCAGILDFKGAMAHGHASECGTSVMLYLYPELVDRDEITCVQSEPNDYPDIIQYSHFTAKTPNGSIGDSRTATAEKGKNIVDACVKRILSYLENAF